MSDGDSLCVSSPHLLHAAAPCRPTHTREDLEGSDQGREGGGQQPPPPSTFTADWSRYHKVFEHGLDEIFSQMLLRLYPSFSSPSAPGLVFPVCSSSSLSLFEMERRLSIHALFTCLPPLSLCVNSHHHLHMYSFLFVLYLVCFTVPVWFWYPRQNL